MSLCLFLHLSYRKIPGDQCEGGFQPDRKETDLRRMCTSNAIYSNSLVSSATLSTLTAYWDVLIGESLIFSRCTWLIYYNQMQCKLNFYKMCKRKYKLIFPFTTIMFLSADFFVSSVDVLAPCFMYIVIYEIYMI